jgi:hypothetical protein
VENPQESKKEKEQELSYVYFTSAIEKKKSKMWQPQHRVFFVPEATSFSQYT